MSLPPTFPARRYIRTDTHRLIPYRYSDLGSVLNMVTASADLNDIFDLESATNDRLLAQAGHLYGFGLTPAEHVAGVRHASIINAAFDHPSQPDGSRFNGPERGAWYAAEELDTSKAEVLWHWERMHAELNVAPGSQDAQLIAADSLKYVDYRCDIDSDLTDLTNLNTANQQRLFRNNYAEPQALAQHLLGSGGRGVLYLSVRRPGHLCVALFYPSDVLKVQQGGVFTVTWNGTPGSSQMI